VSACDESFANRAAGNVVFSRDFNVQVWEGIGDCLIELPNALAPFELPHRDKVIKLKYVYSKPGEYLISAEVNSII